MQSSANLDSLISEISKLDYLKKIEIVESVLQMIKFSENKQQKSISPKLTDLKGLGAEIWNDTDVEKYLQNERQWD